MTKLFPIDNAVIYLEVPKKPIENLLEQCIAEKPVKFPDRNVRKTTEHRRLNLDKKPGLEFKMAEIYWCPGGHRQPGTA